MNNINCIPGNRGQKEGFGIRDLESLKNSQLPPEMVSDTRIVTNQHKQAVGLRLKRGQYKVSGFIPAEKYKSKAQLLRDLTKAVPEEGEFKRIHFYKVDLQDPETKTIDGKERTVQRFTAVFRIIDNPLPLAPIIWGVSIIGSGVAGWFFVDKLEEFTSSTAGGFITIVAGVLTIMAIIGFGKFKK